MSNPSGWDGKIIPPSDDFNDQDYHEVEDTDTEEDPEIAAWREEAIKRGQV